MRTDSRVEAWLSGPLQRFVSIAPTERRAVLLAMACNFVLLASFYLLRPVRDTMATVFGAAQLQQLFTATFAGMLLCAPVYARLTTRFRLMRLLPGLFAFWLLNILVFSLLLHAYSASRWTGAAYYVWFSVTNLYMISVFWSLMAELFTPSQAVRLFAPIAASGSIGAIVGPVVTRLCVHALGLDGLLRVAAGGFLLLILLVRRLVAEKARLRLAGEETQASTLERALPGSSFEGFRLLFESPYLRNQALFMLLMTWAATITYFQQTAWVAAASTQVTVRTELLANIDLAVNVLSALVLVFGLSSVVRRLGVTAALLGSPLVMLLAFAAFALAPSLLLVQVVQVARRVSQYAIARPSREICFTVLDQASRYKAKNVIDTAVYRLGDVSAAWIQAGLRAAGSGAGGPLACGILVSLAWGASAVALGRRYEQLRGAGSEYSEPAAGTVAGS